MIAAPLTAGRWVLLQLPTVLVLAALAGIGYVGYLTEWKVPKLSALWTRKAGRRRKPRSSSCPTASQQNPDPCVRQFQKLEIQFPEAEDVTQAGLQLAPVATRPHGTVRRRQRNGRLRPERIAHLSVPVPGIAWRVDKHKGDQVKKGDVLVLVESADVGKAKAEFKKLPGRGADAGRRRSILLQPSTRFRSDLDRGEKRASRPASIQLNNAQQTLINLGLPVQIEDVDKLSEHDLSERMRTLGLPDAIAGRSMAKDVGQPDSAQGCRSTARSSARTWCGANWSAHQAHSIHGGRPEQDVHPSRRREEDRDRVQLDQEASPSSWTAASQRTRRRQGEVDQPRAGGKDPHHARPRRGGKPRRAVARPQLRDGPILVRSIPNAVAVPDEAVQTKDRCHFVSSGSMSGKVSDPAGEARASAATASCRCSTASRRARKSSPSVATP